MHIISGLFKDETGGVPVREFVGLMSKMYSILKDDETVKDAAKGVDAYVKEYLLNHSDYLDGLFSEKTIAEDITRIVQQSHNLYKQVSRKICLRAFNDKKYVIREGDEFTSYSFGNQRIDEIRQAEAKNDFDMNVNYEEMFSEF